MDDTNLKAAYAAFLLKERDPFKAACLLSPDDTGKALWYATNWAHDPEVMAELDALRGDARNLGAIATKFDLARFYWDMAKNENIEAKDRLLAAEKFGAVAGIYDPKANNNTTVNIDAAPRVMIVKDHGTDDQWSKAVEQQQRALVNGRYVANSTRH